MLSLYEKRVQMHSFLKDFMSIFPCFPKREKISKTKKIAEGKIAAKLATIATQQKPRW
jgi:hypothetical protein